MKVKAMAVTGIVAAVMLGNACATKKYVRNRVNERATPLESRTGELEETSRRSTQDISRLGRDVEDVRQKTDRAQQQADRAASSAEQANTRVTGVEQTVSDLRTNLDKYIQFKASKSELLPEAMAALDELASQIKDRNGFLLEIEGFASAEGKADLNERLSQARSEAVKRYLAERHNIPLFRMAILGFGVSRPVAPNETKEGREQNRRVEVRLLTNNAVSQQTR
jgi:outer membrane protein OmpA-like peptidoglycan-associated protein